MAGGKRYHGGSVQKRAREEKKKAEQLAKLLLRGRISATTFGTEQQRIPRQVREVMAKKGIRINTIELKQIGTANWFPTITTDAWAKLCNHERASVGQYVYTPNRAASTERFVCFEVSVSRLSNGKVEKPGTFLIDVEKKTIERATGKQQ
jgi:hypothetical protein